MARAIPETRASWSGQLAFVLAAAASAVGLGNLWRFPYLAAKYGGGVFIAVYLALSLTLGFALLVTEIAIGRKSRQSQLTAFTALGHRRWAWVGWLSTLVPLLIAPYYAVIGGWVVRYFIRYLGLVCGYGGGAASAKAAFDGFLAAPNEPFAYMCVFIALTVAVLLVGVKRGIEKANVVLMPALLAMALFLAVWVAFQPGAGEGIRYYLVPDFSSCDNLGKVVLGAMGQMFFSLSLAMGIMVTYGSYMRREDSIPRGAVRVVAADTFVAALAGFMVIPMVHAFAVKNGFDVRQAMDAGPGLMFITLPEVFRTLGPAGDWIGLAFFSLVLFAALTSAISMSEACLAAVCDATGIRRRGSALLVGAFCVVCGAFSAFSYGRLASVKLMGLPILDFIDAVVNSAIMPVTALGICLFVGWALKPKGIVDEIELSGERFRVASAYGFAMRYLVPILIVAILVSEICRTFGIGGWKI